MKITKEKAIEILTNQKNKLNQKGATVDNIWISETAEYVKRFLGSDSSQYSLIISDHFRTFPILHTDTTDYRYFDQLNIKNANQFINSCIESINNNGVYKPKGNFITKMDDAKFRWFIGGLCTSLILIGTIIYNQGYKDGKNESIRTMPKSITVTPQESNADSTSVNDSNKKEPRNHSDSSKK